MEHAVTLSGLIDAVYVGGYLRVDADAPFAAKPLYVDASGKPLTLTRRKRTGVYVSEGSDLGAVRLPRKRLARWFEEFVVVLDWTSKAQQDALRAIVPKDYDDDRVKRLLRLWDQDLAADVVDGDLCWCGSAGEVRQVLEAVRDAAAANALSHVKWQSAWLWRQRAEVGLQRFLQLVDMPPTERRRK